MKCAKIFIGLSLISLNIHAQKCHYDIDKYDKFLKIRKLEKEVKVNGADFGGDGYLKLTFCKYDTLVFFRINYITRHAAVVSRSDELIFLLDNDATVKAHPDQIYSGYIRLTGPQSVLDANYFFDNSDDINILKTGKVKSIRINYNSIHQDYDIKGKFAENLFDVVQCF